MNTIITQSASEATAQPALALPPMAAGSRWAPRAWLAWFAIAVGLRCAWLDYDLPLTPEIDAFKFVDEAQRMVQTGHWQPNDFQYPTGYTYLLAVADRLFDLRTPYAAHLAARILSASFGLGTLWTLGSFTGSVAGPWAALVAVGLVGFSPLHVTMSRSVAPDAMLTFWVSLGILMLFRPNPTLRRNAYAGACFGLALATKFTALYALAWLPVLAAAGWPAGTSSRRRLLGASTALAAAAAALVIADPWLLLLAREYRRRFQFELLLQAAGQVGHVQRGLADYLVSLTPVPEQPWLSSSLWGDLGPAALLVAAGTAWGLCVRAQRWPLMAALYALGYLFAISSPGHIKALRFTLPILPLLAALAGAGSAACLQHLGARGRWLLGAALLLMLCVPLVRSVDTVRRFAQPSSVARFRVYAAAHVPPRTLVFIEPFSLGDYRPLRWRVAELTDVGSRQYGLPPKLGPNPERSPLLYAKLVEQLHEAGVEYLVLHSYFENELTGTPDNLRWFPRSVENYQRFVAAVEQRARFVHRERGFVSGAMGPEISIWRLPKTAAGP
jgi:hypothetical protein